MANETISVVYEPLGVFDSITYYHETLVYTNSSGEQFIATAGPNGSPPAGNSQFYDVSEAGSAAASGTTSVYGTLATQSGPISNFSQAALTGWLGTSSNPNPSEVLATGADLSSKWDDITQSYATIGGENLAYSPLTQNSNSTATSAMLDAGLTPPTDTGMLGSYWAPAAGTDLTTTCSTDDLGNTVLAINENDGSGDIIDSLQLVTSPDGKNSTMTISTDGVLDDAEAQTVNADGSQTDNTTGYNTNGSVKFTQDTNISSSGQATSTISGTGDVTDLDDASIALSDDTLATLRGTGNGVTLGDNATLTDINGGNTITAAGDGDSITTTAGSSADTVYLQGTNGSAMLNSTGDTGITLDGGDNNSVTLQGDDETATLGGVVDSANVSGNDDTVNLQGVIENATLAGANDVINMQSLDGNATLSGTGDTVITSGSGEINTVNLQGSSESATLAGEDDWAYVTGDTDTVSLQGSFEFATLAGTDGTATTSAVGEGNSVELDGNSQTVTLAGEYDFASLYGSNNTVTATGENEDITSSVDSNSNIVNLQGTSGNVDLSGTGDTVTTSSLGSNNYISLEGDSESATLAGIGDSVYFAGDNGTASLLGDSELASLYASGSVSASGISDTISAADGDSVTISNNGQNTSAADSVTLSNGTLDLEDTASAALTGSNDTVNVGADDDLTISGDGNAVSASSGSNIWLNSNGSNTLDLSSGDTINVTDSENGITDTVTMSAGAINLGSDTQLTVNGDGNTASGGSGSVLTDNYTDGASSIVSFDPSSGVAVESQNYSGSNGSGTYLSDVLTFTAGDSQAQYFADLPSGTSSEIVDYAGPNGSGTLDTAYFNLTGGGSVEQLYTGLPDGVSEEALVYSGANESGTLLDELGDFTSGGSEIALLAGLPSQISDVAEWFDGSNLTGLRTNLEVDLNDGASVLVNYDYNGSDVETSYQEDIYFDGSQVAYADFTAAGGYIDGSAGNGSLASDGGYGDFESYGGYINGGGYEFTNTVKPSGTNVGTIAQYDLQVNAPDAAQAAASAQLQAYLAANPSLSGLGGSSTFEGSQWSGNAITWSLATSPGTTASPFSGYMDSQYEALVQQAFQTWAAASGLTFEEVPDSAQSDIRIGWGDFDTSSSGVVGYTSYQSQSGGMLPNTIIRLEDPSQNPLIAGPDGSLTYSGTESSVYQVLLHEIGHALGLADNADPNSIMYYEATGNNQTLDSTDVAGIQALYSTAHQQLIQAMASLGAEAGAAASLAPAIAHTPPPITIASPMH